MRVFHVFIYLNLTVHSIVYFKLFSLNWYFIVKLSSHWISYGIPSYYVRLFIKLRFSLYVYVHNNSVVINWHTKLILNFNVQFIYFFITIPKSFLFMSSFHRFRDRMNSEFTLIDCTAFRYCLDFIMSYFYGFFFSITFM